MVDLALRWRNNVTFNGEREDHENKTAWIIGQYDDVKALFKKSSMMGM